MDSNQPGASGQSASQQTPCSTVAADRVQDRREGEVQRYYSVGHGTDQDVLNRAKRLVPRQGPGVLRGPRWLGVKSEQGPGASGNEPSDVRFWLHGYFAM
jgi:hypothetical protein